jgi:hypothetical protein
MKGTACRQFDLYLPQLFWQRPVLKERKGNDRDSVLVIRGFRFIRASGTKAGDDRSLTHTLKRISSIIADLAPPARSRADIRDGLGFGLRHHMGETEERRASASAFATSAHSGDRYVFIDQKALLQIGWFTRPHPALF